MLTINRTPARKPLVNLSELHLVQTAHRRAYRPGLCHRMLLAGIVATGTLQGLDLTDEAEFELAQLEAPGRADAQPLMRVLA